MSRTKAYLCSCHCCGRWFPSTRQDAIYCQPRCRKRASRIMCGDADVVDPKYFRPDYVRPWKYNVMMYE